MPQPVRLRVYVSEPFDFERQNDSADLFGTTLDSTDPDADEWVIDLDGWFRLGDDDYDVVLVAPRYVGEQLSRVFDSILGFPVRIAHRVPDGWRFAMTGMLSLAPPSDEDVPDGPADQN